MSPTWQARASPRTPSRISRRAPTTSPSRHTTRPASRAHSRRKSRRRSIERRSAGRLGGRLRPPELGGIDLMLLEEIVERRARDPEELCGARQVTPRDREGLTYGLRLRALACDPEVQILGV